MTAHRHPGPGRGFTLIEVLFTTVLSSLLLVFMLGLSDGLRRLARDQSEVLEMDLSLRGGLEFVARDLQQAGYGLRNVPYASDFGVVFPNATSADTWATDAVTIWYNPTDTRATLIAPMALASADVVLDQVTSFAAGERVLIAGPGADGVVRREFFLITGVLDAAEKHLEHRMPENASNSLLAAFQTGSVVVKVVDVSWRAGTDAEGRTVLYRRVGNGAESVAADDVTLVGFTYFNGANPPAVLTSIDTPAERRAIRGVRIDLRARTELPSRVTKRIREVLLSTEVAPRNLVLGG